MAKTFKNWSEIEKYLVKQISSSMQLEVAKEVVDVMVEPGGTIDEDVYKPYTPYSTDGVTPHYIRTYELKNPANFDTKMVDSNTLSVRSTRSENGRDIAEVIEYGKGYNDWGYTRDLDEEIGARPFHQKTKEKLQQTGRHVKALKRGLTKRGLKVVD